MRVDKGRVALTTRERTQALSLSLGSALLAWILWVAAFAFFDGLAFRRLDDASQEHVLKTRAERWQTMPPSVNKWKDRIVVIQLDDHTLAQPKFDQWPVDRRYYAELIEMLSRAGAKSIGLDILFLDRSSSPKSDAVLAEAVKKHKSVVLVNDINFTDGVLGFEDPVFTRGWTEEERKARVGVTFESQHLTTIPPVVTIGKQERFLFDVLLAARAMDVPMESIRDESEGGYGQGRVVIGDTRIPVVNGEMYINYFWGGSGEGSAKDSPQDAFLQAEQRLNYFHFSDLWEMDDATRVDFFKGRTVLVGVTGEAGHDIKSTPLGRMAGIDVHANVLLSLLSGEFVSPVALYDQVGILLVIVLLMGLMVPRLHWALGAVLAVALATTVYAVLPYLWIYQGQVYPPSLAMFATGLSFTAVLSFQLIIERRAKQRLSDLIQKVAPMPDRFIQDFLESRQQALTMGGVKQYVSILFSDIRGYTDMSEKMDAVTLMNTLNGLYTEMGHIIHKHGGAIFDYIGDAQMVVFGLDDARRNHPDEAVQCALAMIDRLEELNEQWTREQQPRVEIGIGVCSGEVSLGIMGSSQRQQFSAIGDVTNLAARLQSMSSQLECQVIISDTTMEALKGRYQTEKVTGVKVKGKAELQTVYKVFSMESASTTRIEMVTQ